MKILIIEDDDFKFDNIFHFLSNNLSCNISRSKSLSDSILRINENDYDVIIIDMAIPSHDIEKGGGAPKSLLNGGIEIILELEFLGKEPKKIILTQYPDIEISGKFYSIEDAKSEIRNSLECNIDACIKYIDSDVTWKQQLKEVMENESTYIRK